MQKLGTRIRTYRERKDMSREELAEKAGLPAEFIASLEDRNHCPSLGPLLKVSRALGERLGTFLDDAGVTDPVIVRKGERSTEMAMHSKAGERETVRFHSLGKGKSDRRMEPFYVELLPENGDKELAEHQGEEFIVVLSGEVELTHGRETHILREGDSLYFNSIVPHHVGCRGDSPAEIYAVLYFPD
jgi:transcriptional regulator with XRE-family HTH domain